MAEQQTFPNGETTDEAIAQAVLEDGEIKYPATFLDTTALCATIEALWEYSNGSAGDQEKRDAARNYRHALLYLLNISEV